MIDLQQEILKIISVKKTNPFLIRDHFKPRQYNLVRTIVNELLTSGKLKLDDDYFLYIDDKKTNP